MSGLIWGPNCLNASRWHKSPLKGKKLSYLKMISWRHFFHFFWVSFFFAISRWYSTLEEILKNCKYQYNGIFMPLLCKFEGLFFKSVCACIKLKCTHWRRQNILHLNPHPANIFCPENAVCLYTSYKYSDALKNTFTQKQTLWTLIRLLLRAHIVCNIRF